MRRTVRLLTTLAAMLVPAAASAQWRTPWSYEKGPSGPERWGGLDPDYSACGHDRAQSPIDISHPVRAPLPPLEFSFHGGPVKIVNNGYTAVRVDYAPGNDDVLSVGGRRYELTQFHFHHPSEEMIKGRRFAMNIHFMFRGDDGKVVGAVVLLKPGRANPAVAKLWAHMASVKGPAQIVEGLTLDPAELLPRGRGYYAYRGSVSAPPCTPGVDWYVLKAPVEVSPAQVAAFARLYPHDVRPNQPLNGRTVQESSD